MKTALLAFMAIVPTPNSAKRRRPSIAGFLRQRPAIDRRLSMRFAQLLFSFTIPLSAFAAAPKLDRPTLAAMFAQRLRPMCTAQLTQKPEFRALRGTQVCDVSVVVTGISKTSESEAIAEWHYVLRAHLPELQRWLEAFQKFSDRMAKLKPVPAANPNSYPKFVDPSDQQAFTIVSLTTGPPNIFTSLTWLDLEKLQNRMQEIIGSDDRTGVTGPTVTSRLRKYDDGWRVVK